ncbi:MAG: hypothetical protein RML72_08155 [Bacteroidia bacterium]|nr:hypothetical protein [Bacteroidia bacterium]
MHGTSKVKILFVDTEEYNLEMYKIFFREYYKVFTASTPVEALDIIHKDSIDVLVAEYFFPPASVFYLLEKAKQTYSAAICVLLTTSTNSYSHLISNNLVDCIFFKPILPQDLHHQMELLLCSRRKYSQLNDLQILKEKLKIITASLYWQSYISPIRQKIFSPETLFLVDFSYQLIELRHSYYSESIYIGFPVSLSLEEIGWDSRIIAEIKRSVEHLRDAAIKQSIASTFYLSMGEENYCSFELKGIKINDTQVMILLTDKTLVFRYREEKRKLHKRVLAALIEGQDREAEQIAKELHENVAQTIIGVKFLCEGLKAKFDSSFTPFPEIQYVIHTLDETVRNLKLLIHTIHFKAVEDFGFVPTLKAYLKTIQENCHFTIQLNVSQNFPQISKNKATSLLKIIQEIVSNVIKHSKADNFLLRISVGDNFIELWAQDNGIGFSLPLNKSEWGSGIKKIIARVQFLSGKIKLKTKPGSGTSYFISIPVY